MNTSNLTAEYLIIGTFSLASITIMYLTIFGVYDIDLLHEIKTITTGGTIMLAIITYILGSITNSLMSTISYQFVKKAIKYKIIRFLFSSEDVAKVASFDAKEQAVKYYYVLNYASEAVIDKFKTYESILRVQKSLIFLLPILGIFGTIWLSKSYPIFHQIVFLSSCLIFAFLSFKTHRITRNGLINLIVNVFEYLKKDNKL